MTALKMKKANRFPRNFIPPPSGDGLGVIFFRLYPQLCENGGICAQLRVQISHGGVCATRKLHKLLRTADRICSVPGADDNSIYVWTLSSVLCVPSKVIERKIHQIRKAEDKVRKS